MSERIYLYPVWIRIWHMSNALMFLVLIVTGLSMQYSSPERVLIRFDYAVSLHNIAGVVLVFSYLIFLIANALTKNYQYYKCNFIGCSKRAIKQFRYYVFGIFKKEEPPFPINEARKFNPLQKMTYLAAMYILMPLLIISGLALLFPEVIFSNVFGFSGIHLTDLLHLLSGYFLSIFMFIHVYFCTIGRTPTSNFKGMITGYHE